MNPAYRNTVSLEAAVVNPAYRNTVIFGNGSSKPCIPIGIQ